MSDWREAEWRIERDGEGGISRMIRGRSYYEADSDVVIAARLAAEEERARIVHHLMYVGCNLGAVKRGEHWRGGLEVK